LNALNGLLSGAVWLPFLGALLHPPLGWLFQKGERLRIPMAVTVGVSNLMAGLMFLSYLRPDWSQAWSGLDALALLNGLFFFLGQWFSVRAVKAGDLVVHTSALGLKLLVVGFLSISIGLEAGSTGLILAVLLAAVGIFMLAGGNLAGWRTHRATLAWTVVGTLFFGLCDILTSWKATELGSARWLILMMASSGLCALGLLSKKTDTLVKYASQPRILGVLAGLGLLMGGQAVLVNTAFTIYREPTVSNVVYATRGLLAIPFLMLINRKWRGVVSWQTALGAVLMLGALVLAV
jgi:hypothetical protein